ncbi:jg4785 [Pararge aegeria aegeria]|uniref:Tubulin-specific chaperone E n=1 Tax=Pararge aegeria aegeria TaxID=348720 RepID=A0A8S4RFY6_9NEOP|nr:jg4785 [Pararge aegeria aegeria]
MVGAMPVDLIPKFCNGGMDSLNGGEDCEYQVSVGSRVKCNDDFGTVKYIGEVQGYKGIWYGVEWDNADRGKHDGYVEDVQYFKTTKQGSGSFVRPNKIAPLKTCAEAIRKYYGDREKQSATVNNELMSKIFLFSRKFDRLLEVCVHDQNVAKAGDVALLCPNVRSLDVSQNLFSNWREIIQLSAQLPDLRELDVSKNRMAIDIPEETLTQLSINFSILEKLNISVCDYEWSDIIALSHLWPKITEIIAAYNRIKIINPPDVTLHTMTVLRLDGNPIDSWYEVMNLGRLKNLKVLSLNDCYIDQIRFGENQVNGKVDVFENLEVLFLNRDRINDWRSVSELNKLKSLKKLYFLKNPVQNNEDYDTGSQLIMAKIGNLQLLEITLRDENGKSLKKKFPSTMAVQKLVTLAQRLFSKGNTGTPTLHIVDEQMKGAEIILDNVMKDLAFFSIKNGDTVVIRFR